MADKINLSEEELRKEGIRQAAEDAALAVREAATSCENCVHFRRHEKSDTSKLHMGFCKRFPPQPNQGHARLQSDDYCGEFKRKET
jgi:hypothetical protein